MNSDAEIFEKIVQNRKSYRAFDETRPISDEVVKRSLKRAILSPNSSNMQLWEFYVIKNKDDIAKMATICLKQNGAKTASQIIVFVARPDKWKSRQQAIIKNLDETLKDKSSKQAKMAYSYYNKLMPLVYNTSFSFIKDIFKNIFAWYKGLNKAFYREATSKNIIIVNQKSVAIAAQTFMLSISAEGFDSLPMEGIDSKRLKAFLKLPKKAKINMVIAVGTGKPEGIYGPRFRVPYNEVVFEV